MPPLAEGLGRHGYTWLPSTGTKGWPARSCNESGGYHPLAGYLTVGLSLLVRQALGGMCVPGIVAPDALEPVRWAGLRHAAATSARLARPAAALVPERGL